MKEIALIKQLPEILAKLKADNGENFTALEFLMKAHNQQSNKELSEHVFFEGTDENPEIIDGLPTCYIACGSSFDKKATANKGFAIVGRNCKVQRCVVNIDEDGTMGLAGNFAGFQDDGVVTVGKTLLDCGRQGMSFHSIGRRQTTTARVAEVKTPFFSGAQI